jgi:hypothetical protein
MVAGAHWLEGDEAEGFGVGMEALAHFSVTAAVGLDAAKSGLLPMAV